MKNIIVTGANGFLGSSLIKKVIKKGVNVIALDNSFKNSQLPKDKCVKEIEVSLDDVKALRNIIPNDNYDALYHFAWQGVNGPEKAEPIIQLNNIKLALNCITLTKFLNCKKILFAGTIAERAVESLEHLDKTSGSMMYGVAKHCAHLMVEAYCKNIGLDFIWMQFSNIYGSNNKTGNLISYTIGEIINGKEATFGAASQPYDFIYVDDLIEAIIRLGEKEVGRNFYFVGSGNPKILKEYLFEIGRQCGKEELIKIGVRQDDGITYTTDMFENSLLRKDIGNYISRSFSEGIKSTLENYL